jgi:preprotein translocase subunit SecD
VATQKSQKSKTTSSRPGRALAGLLVLIIVMLLAIVGGDAFSPGHWKHDFKVQLGLDLSSGTQATLTAQTTNGKPINSAYMKEAIAIMIARVNGAGFSGAQVQQQGTNNIVVTVPGKNANDVLNLVGQTAQLLFRQVLLVGGPGSTASTSATPSPIPSTTPSSSPGSTPSSSPSSTPSSATSSPHAAGLPGMSGQNGARGLSSGSRLLAAKAHASSSPPASSSPSSSSSPSTSASPTPTPTSTTPASTPAAGNASLVAPGVRKLFDKLNCSNLNKWKSQIGYTTTDYDNPNQQIVSCAAPSSGFAPGTKFVLDKAKVLGKDVTGAQAGVASSQQSLSDKWQVNVSLNGKGAAAFSTLTSQMYSKYYTAGGANPLDDLAIVLDGVVISAPQIQGAIPGGQAQITYFPQSEAQLLAQQLNYGALPVTLKKQNVNSVSPALGRDQLNAGLLAAGIGLALVVLYSFIYYRGLGIVSVSSLIIASILAYGSVVLLSKYASSGFSLELSGIAGLIVAIGITADSFVVFFERLRDEVREGKSLRPAVESGWRRARRTILVSDTVSFLAALLLWYFSVSDVKGFAFTLGLTTIIDIVVVFLFTKPMVSLLARTKFFSSGHRMSGLDPVRLGARTPWRSSLPRPATRVTREA